MTIELGAAVGKILIDTSGVTSGINAAKKSLDGAKTSLASVGTAAIRTGLGVTAMTAPIAAVGIAVFNVGVQFDEVMDGIRTTTGATGDELIALGADVKAVFGAIPTDMATAGQAIAELNARTGQTGEGLQELAKVEIELARITGGELGPQIANTTRLFGDWGIAVKDQVPALDALFRAHQETGIAVDALAAKLVQYGAPLRQMGFSFTEATALIAKFEKEGVNTELVLGSLRIALGKMAKAGVDPKEALKQLISAIKNTGSTAEANKLAIEVFGARAGPDLAAGIREGRFEVEAIWAAIANGKETVLGAANDTNDFAEKFCKLRNQVSLAALPLGVALFEALNNLIPVLSRVAEFVTKLTTAFASLPTGMQTGILALLGITVAIGPVITAIGTMTTVVGALGPIFSGLGAVAAGALGLIIAPAGLVVLAIAAIGAIVAGTILLFNDMGDAAESGFGTAVEYIQEDLKDTEAEIETLKAALDIDPNDVGLLTALAAALSKATALRAEIQKANLAMTAHPLHPVDPLPAAKKTADAEADLRWLAQEGANTKITDDYAAKIQSAIESAISGAQSALQGLMGGLKDPNAPGANGPFENIFRAADVAVNGSNSQWAEKLGLDQATAQQIVADFQKGLITDQVKALIDVPALVGQAKTAALAQQLRTQFINDIAKAAGTGPSVVEALMGTGTGTPPATAAAATQAAELVTQSKTNLAGVTSAWKQMQTDVTTVITAVQQSIVTWLANLQLALTPAWLAMQLQITTIWTAIQLFFTTWRAADLLALQTWLAAVKLALTTAWTAILANTLTSWEAMRAGAVGAMQLLYDQVVAILTILVQDGYDAGVAFAGSVAQGIKDEIEAAVEAARELAAAVDAVLPHSDAREGPLSHLTDSGRSIPATLAQGMLAGAGELVRAMGGMLATPTLAGPGPRAAGAAASAAPAAAGQAINVTINNPVGETAENSIVRQLRNLSYIGVLG
jgi:hypothetical protein